MHADIKDTGSILGLGRSPGEGHGDPIQYSCLENPMDRRAWWATVHGIMKSWTRLKWLSIMQQLSQEKLRFLDYSVVLVTQLCPTLVVWRGLEPAKLLFPWNSPGQNTGVRCHFLLQGIFPRERLNPGLLHGRQILYQLSHQGIPSCSVRSANKYSRESRDQQLTSEMSFSSLDVSTDLWYF